MRSKKYAATVLGLAMLVNSGVNAETMPQILANFPDTQDDAIKEAFSDHVRASFPRDIRTSTLKALLEMDGFTVSDVGDHYAARFVNATFPCITDYSLTWSENDYGHVINMKIAMSNKCV